VDKIDQQVADITELRVFPVKYADVTDLANQISMLYPDETTTGNSAQGPFPFFFRGGFGGQRAATPDEHARKMGRVIAVPEPRTKKLMVTAAKSLMPQIAEMVEELDVKGQQEIVGVYDLKNADPWDIQEALSDLFNRTTVHMTANANSSKTLMGPNNPLSTRATQPQQNLNTTTTMGTSGGAGGGLGR
jgi:hypothetical protein